MSEPFYVDPSVTLHAGDCLDVLPMLADASVSAVVTDPPYALNFMGKNWDTFGGYVERNGSSRAVGDDGGRHDEGYRNMRGRELEYQQWCKGWAAECLRVLKPGGHLLAFGGTRTAHRLACAVEDAGFEIRDSIAWLYGSGFPKSLDVSKAIDKAAGAEREVIGEGQPFGRGSLRNRSRVEMGYRPTELNADGGVASVTAPATDDAKRWQGWGTALKPAHEPIIVARKPLDGTVAANVLAHGTGALNIDATRVGDGAGRWPPNVVLDEVTAADLDEQTGTLTSGTGAVMRAAAKGAKQSASIGAESRPAGTPMISYSDTGGGSRFFPVFRYQAKAPTRERPKVDGVAHPTVKPLALMRWLVRLVTPPGGIVLDPFAGSGTTAEACILEGFRCIAIERETTYLPLIMARLSKPLHPTLDVECE